MHEAGAVDDGIGVVDGSGGGGAGDSQEHKQHQQQPSAEESSVNDDRDFEQQRQRMRRLCAKQHQASLGLHLLINMLITLALSLAIYFVFANALLTVHRLTIRASTSFGLHQHRSMFGGDDDDGEDASSSGGGEFFFDPRFSPTDNHNNNNGKRHFEYYDCSRNILSTEECNTINTYHSEYLNYVRLLKATSNPSRRAMLKQANSLKVNTSFYVH